jgi:uncharacterized Fe-S center protein
MAITHFIKKEETGKLEIILKVQLNSVFNENDRIAVKLHMGEAGNRYFIKPEFVKKIIKILGEMNTKPFLFDSPVMYPGSRDTIGKYYDTAMRHGFTGQDIGCPVIISDDSVKVRGKHIEYEVCRDIAEADGILVISHVKGHMCTGFGGAIKNLGMGGVSKNTKRSIHVNGQPSCTGECTLCGTCVEICPVDAVKIDKEKVVFDYNFGCWGCGVCAEHCPENTLTYRKASFDELIADSAHAVLKGKEKQFYINVVNDITRLCDCLSDPGEILIPDVGIVLSDDIVDAERNSLKEINDKAGKDLFREVHRKNAGKHVEEMEKLRT